MTLFFQFRGVSLLGLAMIATYKVVAQSAAPVVPPMPRIEYTNVAPGVMLHQSSPVLYFRGILGMTPAQREKALANKPAEATNALLKKVAEYTNLPKEVREARLRLTELQWELTTVVTLAPTNQAAFIKDAAPEDRPLLEDWLRFQSLSSDGQKAMLVTLNPNRHQALTQALKQWQAVPESDRQQASGQFLKIAYLTPNQRAQTLSEFSDAERKTMEAALKNFAALPEVQRNVCIASFKEFANMAPAERDEFLKNAARWESMTPSERKLWQTLVQKIEPPSPPGLTVPSGVIKSVRYPPLPPGMILLPPSPPGMPAMHAAVGNPKP